jgi:peptide/nickel transport system substrate-binding protein
MGMLNNEIDILQDITPESMLILSERSEYVRAWWPSFPYAQFDDPCARGILFNTAVEPFDNVDVRWALALSIDIETLAMASFGGMLRVNPLNTPPVGVLQRYYHFPMEEWLVNFELEPGYRPFSTDFAWNMVQRLQAEGVEGLPTNEADAREMFGAGWWRHDPEKAAELLERHGFTNSGGSWMKPDGTPFTITINAPADFETQSARLAFAAAEQWRGFGVDANVQQMVQAAFWDSEALGHFDAIASWPGCGILPDTSINMAGWHGRHIAPLGERAAGAHARWQNPRVNDAIDQALLLPPNDPQVVELMTEVFREIAMELPNLAMFGTSNLVPVNTYYWEGFQTDENPFEGPWWWWSQFKYHLPHYRPAGR